MSCFDLSSPSGLRLRLHAHGGLQRIDGPEGLLLNLFPGSLAEGGPAQLWLRRHTGEGLQLLPLLGPGTPLRFALHEGVLHGQGSWQGLELALQLRLAETEPAWFWHLQIENRSGSAQRVDWIAVQDVGLSAYDTVRLNEHYVSQYIDLCPLDHPRHGKLLAARQNQKFRGRHPWLLMGSLRRAEAFATDGLQLHGLALREGHAPLGVQRGLGAQRLQHEHALMALQEGSLSLAPAAHGRLGMGWLLLADHAAASQAADVARWDALLTLPEAQPRPARGVDEPAADAAPSLFARAPWLEAGSLSSVELDALFGSERRATERDGDQLLSFFTTADAHVVLAEKERRVQRPHGHLLRSGDHRVPDEAALTSTVWMGGVFHSMLTQGHVSFNRLLSTQRSYLGYQRSSGLRLFVDAGQGWSQLGLPAAFEMGERHARWVYRLGDGLLEVLAEADASDPTRMALRLRRLGGAPLRLLASLHLALAGDDGELPGATRVSRDPDGRLRLRPPPDSEMARRFPDGAFLLSTEAELQDDGALFADGRSRGLPFVCLEAALQTEWRLQIEGALLPAQPLPEALRGEIALPRLGVPEGASRPAAEALAQILPWYRHNALVHYLSPRGLEQFNGGGWGTRDVCQGPLEMLLALGHTAPVRDLLCHVFAAQNPDGDWPQWFMFFARDAAVRAGDSHGDIVFWPLLGLARYLLASGDAGLLDEPLPFHGEAGAQPLRAHVERALALIRRRVVPGTRLAAYWHGDWNDSLQPADPALRERLCSSWTVTLHQQTLATLAEAFASLGLDGAAGLRAEAAAVAEDFQRLLMRDGVVAGYARFDAPDQAPTLLLHPGDRETGLRYSLLPMMHAVSNELFSPVQAQQHLALMQGPLQGVDGARLFDAPLAYRGGPETLFQRAETAAFFGREIGVMYTHAHLRYAECLAHLGQAQAFYDALQLAHPVALRERLPMADLRQANCYFSSSDAAFPDRYTASHDYAQALQGRCRLDGGWRVYSSGPGLAIAIIVRHLLGWQLQARWVDLDPVLPPALDGLVTELELDGQRLRLRYRVGSQGHGVRALRLDGCELAFDRQPNAYRLGAARLPRAGLRGGRELELELG